MSNNTNQSRSGAKAYDQISRNIQSEHFKIMTSSIDIKRGWKILDVGCGTGSDTASLLSLVGEEGHVIGIDPIKERIRLAASNICQSDRLKFHVAFGDEASNFGNDFDLVVSNQVMQWIPTYKKPATFQSISDSLKPGAQFVYLMGRQGNIDPKFLKLNSLLPKYILETCAKDLFYESKETLKEIALKNGFDDVTIEETSIHNEFESLDDFFTWITASLHMFDFDTMFDTFKEVERHNDLSFMYNEEKKVDMTMEVYLAKCKKN